MPYKKMPPQAYTKETLQEAFEWWNQQPDEFRDKVQDKDDLVGYYLRVRRKSGGSDISDVAKASFSSELKGLARNLDNFEGYKSDRSSSTGQSTKPNPSSSNPYQQQSSQDPFTQSEKKGAEMSFEPSMQLKFPDMSKSPVVTAEVDEAYTSKPSTPTSSPQSINLPKSTEQKSLDRSERYFKLDEKSYQVIKKTREALNLSSDNEALRAIIALGESKIKSLL